jgi:hypothetical protein
MGRGDHNCTTDQHCTRPAEFEAERRHASEPHVQVLACTSQNSLGCLPHETKEVNIVLHRGRLEALRIELVHTSNASPLQALLTTEVPRAMLVLADG